MRIKQLLYVHMQALIKRHKLAVNPISEREREREIDRERGRERERKRARERALVNA